VPFTAAVYHSQKSHLLTLFKFTVKKIHDDIYMSMYIFKIIFKLSKNILKFLREKNWNYCLPIGLILRAVHASSLPSLH
jgi:hypothetical protein